MASSSSSATRDILARYLAGQASAERLMTVVAETYYRGRGRERERLQPVIDVFERVAPGVAGLVRTEGGAGFDIRLVERPFPKQEEPRLRQAVEDVLADLGAGAGVGLDAATAGQGPQAGLLSRLVRAVRRLFSASG